MMFERIKLLVILLLFNFSAQSQKYPYMLFMRGANCGCNSTIQLRGYGAYKHKGKLDEFSGDLAFIPIRSLKGNYTIHRFIVNFQDRKERYKVFLSDVENLTVYKNKDTITIKRLDDKLICRNIFGKFYDDDILNFDTGLIKKQIYCTGDYREYPYTLTASPDSKKFNICFINKKKEKAYFIDTDFDMHIHQLRKSAISNEQ